MDLTELIIDTLAIARITRLVTTDQMTASWRDRLWARYPIEGMRLDRSDGWRFTDTEASRWVDTPGLGYQLVTVGVEHAIAEDGSHAHVTDSHPLGYVASCDWCSSVWIACGVVAARALAPRAWRPLARALAGSQLTGMLTSR